MGVLAAKRKLWISMVLLVQQVDARGEDWLLLIVPSQNTQDFPSSRFRRFCAFASALAPPWRVRPHVLPRRYCCYSLRYFPTFSIVRSWRAVDLPAAFERIKFLRHVSPHIFRHGARGERARQPFRRDFFARAFRFRKCILRNAYGSRWSVSSRHSYARLVHAFATKFLPICKLA